jgi:hypothetical protein
MNTLSIKDYEFIFVIGTQSKPEYQPEKAGAALHMRISGWHIGRTLETGLHAASHCNHLMPSTKADMISSMPILLSDDNYAKWRTVANQVVAVSDVVKLALVKPSGV